VHRPGCARPCNTGSKPNGRSLFYGGAQAGNGYAVCVPFLDGARQPHIATITSRMVEVTGGAGATLSYRLRCLGIVCRDDQKSGLVANEFESR
jgi:hypothetical protein